MNKMRYICLARMTGMVICFNILGTKELEGNVIRINNVYHIGLHIWILHKEWSHIAIELPKEAILYNVILGCLEVVKVNNNKIVCYWLWIITRSLSHIYGREQWDVATKQNNKFNLDFIQPNHWEFKIIIQYCMGDYYILHI